MPIQSNVRVDVRDAGQRVDTGRSAEQAVQVRERDGGNQQPVEVQQLAEVREAPVQRQQYQQASPSYVEQAAARDMGSMARTQPQAQTQQRVQEQPAMRNVRQATADSGMAAAAQTARGIPVIDASQVASAPVMSSRTTTYDDATRMGIHEALAESGADIISARMASRGAATPAVPSAQAASTLETARISNRRKSSTDTSQAMMDARSQQSAAKVNTKPVVSQQSNTQQATVDSARPNSIFNRSFGWNGKTREARTRQPSTKRPSSVIKAVKDRMARSFKRSGVGYRIYQKMLALPTLGFREVGVGLQEIMAAQEQDPTMLNRLLQTVSDEPVDIGMWSARELATFINQHDIYVGTFKPPNNRGQDVQRRRLRVLTTEQRGIYLHPVMAAMYTADFDGDDMEVSLDPQVAELAKDPMDYMIGIDGKQSLNIDFLPVSKIVDGYADGKTARDYVREVMLSSIANLDGRTLRPLIDAVIELGNTEMLDSDSQAAAYGKVFDEARKVADAANPTDKNASDAMMSRLCQSVYHGMQVIKVQNALTTIDADIVGMDKLPDPRSYDDSAIYKLADGIVNGVVPNNFQELKVMLSGFIGNVKGKNAPFRFTADVGKMMKMDSRLQVGDGTYKVNPNDEAQMRMFFESTVKFAESRIMAREIKQAGRSQYYTQLMRDRVIKEIGFPDSIKSDGTPRYDSYAQFLDEFWRSYNRNSAIINEANLVYLSNMGIASDSNRGLVSPLNPSQGGLTLGDIAEPMLSIYGTYSVGRMFNALSTSGVMGEKGDDFWKGNPNGRRNRTVEREYDYRGDAKFWITGKYLSYSLRAFVSENRLVRGDTGIEAIRARKVSSMDGTSDIDAQFDMLMAIADKRTGTASKFNKSVYGTVEGERASNADETTVGMMGKLLKELDRLDTDGTVSGRRDQMLWVNDVIDTLIMSGPDMFTYFGMDSAAGFLQSKWTKKMVEHANDVEMLGGIRTAMVFDYRMERITALTAEMPDPNVDLDQYMWSYNNLEFARDELGAASEVWHGIISEFMAEESAGQESVFQMMRSGSLMQRGVDGRQYAWDIQKDAGKFWANPGGHDTLRSVIEDLDLDRETKWNVITDVVRYWEQDAYLKSYEVGYQLEIGNDSSYSLNSGARQSALGIHRDFEKAFNRWGKESQEKIQDNIDDAFRKHGGRQGSLMGTLHRLDSAPWELIAIDDDMYADSVLSVKDKTYAQTEKASQHPWTNAIYAALSFQRNGGYMNDITRTDDRLLGLVSVDAVGIQDVIHILANADAEMWVYNQYGEVGQVTRAILLNSALGRDVGDNATEADIWEFLRQEPRIASAIRAHNACVSSDTDGSGYVGSTLSTSETIGRSSGGTNPIDHVKYLMRDHPIYAGIISLASPAHGAVTRGERTRIRRIESYLAHQIYDYASSDMSSVGSANAMLADLGITKEALRDAMRSDYDKFLDIMGLPMVSDSGESDADADFTYQVVSENLVRYVDEVRENVPLNQPNVESVEKPSFVGIDVESVASFWDVLQELGGAKTSVSTGIEGAETYQFGEWASHISARDRFADLEAVFDDVDQSWNGLWTMLRNPDGSPMLLEVDESGTITNYRQLMDAKKAQGMNEVVTSVPAGYDVRDRSTDSHGNPVPSLFAYMVSKRSNGAEAFNLKAKKAGLDGKDSVTKMQGKYRMVDDGKGGMMRANYFDTEWNLQKLAQQNGENGLNIAKTELAIMMMQENSELGYDDLTLANYMCIADLMLIQDTEGQIHLRSLEMLFSAIKYRLGSSVDEMSDAEIIEEANGIVNDNSETGVGIAEMRGVEAFDGIRPRPKSSSVSGIRQKSSVFERNYDLLSAIEADARRDNVMPMSQARARQLTDKNKGVAGIKEVIDRLDVARNYSIVGYAAAQNGSEDISWTVGPSNAIVIGDGDVSDARVAEICRRAYELGMTLFVSVANRDKIPNDLIADAMVSSVAGDALVPCFDMRLNGSEAAPYNGGRFAVFQAPFSRYVVSVEDSINEYQLGDAQYKPTRALSDRIKVIDNGSVQIKAEDLFPNVFRNKDFRHSLTTVTLASGQEVSRLISNGVRCSIDYGVVEGGKGFEQRKHDVDTAIERYQARWSEANADGMLMGDMVECAPGDIVAWAECEIRDQLTDEVQYVLAPIIPFPLHGATKGIPERFSVQQVGYVDSDNTLMAVDWTNTSDVQNSFAKYFDSSGGANKGMVDFTDVIEDQLVLRDGTPVDAYCAKASTDSRKIGTDRRIKTMISLMALARMHGYNFAKSDGAFPSDDDHPENDDIRERMLSKRIPRSEWGGWLTGRDMLFTNDPKLNAFLNYECKKIYMDGGNPADYLANVYTDANGAEHNTHVMWEFEAMFDQGLNYEDGLLRFIHTMDPKFCPNGIDDAGDYTFRLMHDGDGLAQGYDSGVLQMQVPHRLSNGSMSYIWDNVYIGMSFFGEDYSGFSRPNIDGASNFLDAMNTMSYYGAQLDEASARYRAMWASADIGRIPRDGGALGKA